MACQIAWGLLDHVCDESCTSDAPLDPNAPGDFIACPQCEGTGEHCPTCNGSLGIRVPCLRRYIDAIVWDLIDAADLVEKTGWPSGKGWADEPAALVDGVQWVWGEYQRIKNELAKRAAKR